MFVRIEAIKIKNFKGINDGEVSFSENSFLSIKDFDVDYSSILGIYGQNGSGKTAIIDALRIIKYLTSGEILPNNIKDYISTGFTSSSIEISFLIEDVKKYYCIYNIEFSNINNALKITSEKISYFDNVDKSMIHLYDYNINRVAKITGSLFKNLDKNEQFALSFNVLNNYNSNDQKSTIFNKTIIDTFNKGKNIQKDYFNLLNNIMTFSKMYLAIYQISYFDNNSNFGIRMRLSEFDNKNIQCKDSFIPFSKASISKFYFESFKLIIDKMNIVMDKIIPSYKIIINEPTDILLPDGTYVSFNLLVNKNDTTYDIQYESNGIKKIISILSGYIDAFNNEGTCIVIDEFDSGVFEYLFGELLYAFEELGSGQLIFTSHNLRPLEKLSYKNLFFTTLDKYNKYSRIKGVKETTNLRDKYYRLLYSSPDTKYYDYVKTNDLIENLVIGGDKVD